MKRIDNWPAILDKFLCERLSVTFEWGKSDCCMFACDALVAITSVDIARDYRGKYKTAIAADKILKEGLNNIVTGTMHDLGSEEINKNFGQRGDLVLINTPNGDALAIINLRGTVTGQGELGLIDYPLDSVIKAWRIK